jgi:metal-sulfur cluster biosynthetic enzyme
MKSRLPVHWTEDGNIDMVTKKEIEKVLKNIPDPELGISVLDLGLIYRIEIDNKTGIITIVMTLTSIGCPLYNLIADPIKEQLSELPGVKKVLMELTFEPPWTVDKMSKEAKMHLGMI